MWGRSATLLAGDNTAGHPPGTKAGDILHIFQSGSIQMVTDVSIDPAGNVWVANNWNNLDAAASPDPYTSHLDVGRRFGLHRHLRRGGPGATAAHGQGAQNVSWFDCESRGPFHQEAARDFTSETIRLTSMPYPPVLPQPDTMQRLPRGNFMKKGANKIDCACKKGSEKAPEKGSCGI